MSADVVTLDEHRARQLTDRIRDAADDLWSLLLEAHEGRAWAALGYRTWEEYTSAEFGMSRSHAYRLLDHSRVLREIEAVSGVSPKGDIGERSTRDLRPHLRYDKATIEEFDAGEIIRVRNVDAAVAALDRYRASVARLRPFFDADHLTVLDAYAAWREAQDVAS